MLNIVKLRKRYHAAICAQVIYLKQGDKPSMADVGSRLSVLISKNLVTRLPYPLRAKPISAQTAGMIVEQLTRTFLEDSFTFLTHLRPGKWRFSLHDNISDFDQYSHLADLDDVIREHPRLRMALGDYLITPDIVVGRDPVRESELNKRGILGDDKTIPRFSPLRLANTKARTLHASISCKWTIRSDRSQNARTEGLNLIRTRKGHTPHIAVLTGEPMPTRIASLAVGTGDIDCVYHFALHELIDSVHETKDEGAIDSLTNMIDGRRLRDISDLPFDLAL